MLDLMLSAWLFAPLFVGLAANGVCLKYGLLADLARPIDGGRTWRGVPIFGVSKTYRGIVAVFAVEPTVSRVLWSAAFVFVAHQAVSSVGAALGMRKSSR